VLGTTPKTTCNSVGATAFDRVWESDRVCCCCWWLWFYDGEKKKEDEGVGDDTEADFSWPRLLLYHLRTRLKG
jgi:hypothetical protein